MCPRFAPRHDSLNQINRGELRVKQRYIDLYWSFSTICGFKSIKTKWTPKWCPSGGERGIRSRARCARSSADLDCPPDSQFNTAPLRIPICKSLFFCKTKWTPKWCPSGGERGIRTLETLSCLHDFQSCALDQLGDFSMVEMNRFFSLFSALAVNEKYYTL